MENNLYLATIARSPKPSALGISHELVRAHDCRPAQLPAWLYASFQAVPRHDHR